MLISGYETVCHPLNYMQHLEASVNHTAFQVVENSLPPGEDVHLRLRRASDASLASDCVCHQEECCGNTKLQGGQPLTLGPACIKSLLPNTTYTVTAESSATQQLLFYVQYQACATPFPQKPLGSRCISQQPTTQSTDASRSCCLLCAGLAVCTRLGDCCRD